MDRRFGRIASAAIVAAQLFSACSPAPSPAPSITAQSTSGPTPTLAVTPTAAPTPRAGGTIHILTEREEFDPLDPQRNYRAEDMAFLGATLFRSLETYAYAPDTLAGTTLTPDLATDLGTPTDGGRTWSFTLRDGVTFQTGAPITCEDVRYGVSRTFGTDRIVGGPSWAIEYLDIPANPVTEPDPPPGFPSAYYGPYDGTGQDLFEQAVECSPDHRTITFHLNRPVADFNATTALGFSPVPKAADTGEAHGSSTQTFPVSSGPYMIQSYTTGEGGKLVLVRNPNWNQASDLVRAAYPDRWEVDLGIDPAVIDQRLVAAQGDDAFAVRDGPLQAGAVSTVFADPETPLATFTGRAVPWSDPYVRYLWINVQRVTNVKIRQAMMVALDRDAMRGVLGGEFYGTFADGVIAPTIGQDYAPTGIWDTFFGQSVPTSGDPALARELLSESGETPPTLAFGPPDTPINRQLGDVVIESLGRAGITVEYKPPCPQGYYCSAVFNNGKTDFGLSGWGADWPNASTVIPVLFTVRGGWDLSNVDDPLIDAAVDAAYATPDRGDQALAWQALNRRAVENAWVIPTFFGREQRLAGTNVGAIYEWPAYHSWPYGAMYVTP
jgi:peptide/nickel transport system substrate-binding protein